MIFPVRCFTCNKIIGDKWDLYKYSIESGGTPTNAFAEININRYCCKRMFLGHVEIIDKLLLYSENKDKYLDEKSVSK